MKQEDKYMVIVICRKEKKSKQGKYDKTEALLQTWGHEIERCDTDTLDASLLVEALRLSENGFDDIVVRHPQSQEIKSAKEYCYSLSFTQAVEFLLYHPELLRTPIVLSETKLLIGYQPEEMRTFIPRFRARRTGEKI